jgi:hypothetical protein
MAAPSDAVVIGIVLALVFSAAIYYIYILFQQLEGKVGVLNTIIFELKKTNEQYMNLYDGPMYESVPAAERLEPFVPTKEVVSEKPAPAPVQPTKEAVEYEFDEEIGAGVAEVSASASLSVNYESMTYKELQAEAKRKHIKGSSKLTKSELIDALKNLDAGTEVVGMGSIDHFSSMDDSVPNGSADEFLQNFEEVISLN